MSTHDLAVEAIIRKIPQRVMEAALAGIRPISLDFLPERSQYIGLYMDGQGYLHRLQLHTGARCPASEAVEAHLLNGATLPAVVEIRSMELAERGSYVLVVFTVFGVGQSLLIPRDRVVWGVVTSAPDPELEALFQ